MPDPFADVQPGDEVTWSAAAENAKRGAARAWRDSQRNATIDTKEQFRQGDIVKVLNNSGHDVDRCGVLGLAGPIFTPFDSLDAFLREVAFNGVTPTADHDGRFAVLLEPAAAGRIARAYVAGVCPVLIDVVEGSHRCAEAKSGSTTELISGDSGSAQILWKESDDGGDGYGYDTGTQWGLIRFASTCAGTNSSKNRCSCLEDTYEVRVSCGKCNVMPKYWWLTLTEGPYGTYGYCYSDSHSTLCDLGKQTYKLTHKVDPYYTDECTWDGSGKHCLDVELTLSGPYWIITVVDRYGCVLVILRKKAEDFNCCGPNTNWEIIGGQCEYEASLVPDPCTCCHDAGIPCPPDGERTCPDVCCDNVCSLTARWNAACPGTTCPEPPGGCVPELTCTSAGEVTMAWQGGCTWYGREMGEVDGIKYDREGTFTGGGGSGTLDIKVLMPDGRYCSYHCAGTWDCHVSVLTCTGCTGTITGGVDPVPYD